MLQELEKNTLAEQSHLYIYSDGVKDNNDLLEKQSIQEVREVIRGNWSFDKIHIVESNQNKGLANSIMDGVSDIIKKYGRVIVLEDDIVTSKGFLEYMNNALDFYQKEKSVMHISGYFLPIRLKSVQDDTFFFNASSCWGWGTWNDRWEKLETDVASLKKKLLDKQLVDYFNIDNSIEHFHQIDQNLSGEICTWSVRWYATITLLNGLCLHPKKSLVQNIGLDGSGQNSGHTTEFFIEDLVPSITVKKIKLEENIKARKEIARFYKKPKMLSTRIKNRFKRMLSK